jgi:preprotein translocase subunit SecG
MHCTLVLGLSLAVFLPATVFLQPSKAAGCQPALWHGSQAFFEWGRVRGWSAHLSHWPTGENPLHDLHTATQSHCPHQALR